MNEKNLTGIVFSYLLVRGYTNVNVSFRVNGQGALVYEKEDW